MGDQGVVLVIDDDQEARRGLVALLRVKGYLVLEAGNGVEALQKMERTTPPALILLDLSMPIMDGRAFLSVKESTPRLAPIPVILLSGLFRCETLEQFPSVVAGMQKPCALASLLTLIENHAWSYAQGAFMKAS